MTTAHPPSCPCWALRDSPPARRGIATALREIQAGTDVGRYAPRDGLDAPTLPR